MAEETKPTIKNQEAQPTKEPIVSSEEAGMTSPSSNPSLKVPVGVVKKWGLIVLGAFIIILLLVFSVKHFSKNSQTTNLKKVFASSEVKNTQLIVSDENAAMKYLQDEHFFEKSRVLLLTTQSEKFIEVDKVVYLLTTGIFPFNQKASKGKIVTSMNQAYDEKNHTLTVEISVDPVYLQSWDEKTLSRYVTLRFAEFVYDMKNGMVSTNKNLLNNQFEEKIAESKKILNYGEMFQVIKK